MRLDELMSAAETLFLEQGVEATTIDGIAELAQVAKGTFYVYFSSKNDLLEAMGRRYTEQFLRRLEEEVDSCAQGDWLSRLRIWIHTNVIAYVETYRMHDIVYTNHHHHNRSNQEKNAILDQLQTILKGGTEAGAWRFEQPRITALMIYAGVHGVTDDVIANEETDYVQFANRVTSVCLRLIGLTESPNV